MYTVHLSEESIKNQQGSVVARLFDRTLRAGSPVYSQKHGCFAVWKLRSEIAHVQWNDRRYQLLKDDLLIFAANDRCSLQTSEPSAIFTILEIDQQNFTDLIPSCALFGDYNLLQYHAETFSSFLSCELPLARRLSERIETICQACEEKTLGYELNVMMQLCQLLLTLVNGTDYCNGCMKSHNGRRTNKQTQALRRVTDYINAHLGEELTLEKLATVSGLSPNYLSNIFRSQTGLKLWDYITEKRVTLAGRLLMENPNDSIITIAMKCGFNNCPNFNRAFKKYTGQTPKRYKTIMQKQENDNDKI